MSTHLQQLGSKRKIEDEADPFATPLDNDVSTTPDLDNIGSLNANSGNSTLSLAFPSKLLLSANNQSLNKVCCLCIGNVDSS
jgi:hypothetical protein